MAKSKRGGSSDIAVLGLAPRSAPPNAKGALVKANAVNSSAQCDLIERVTIKGTVWFAIGVLSPRSLAAGVHFSDPEEIVARLSIRRRVPFPRAVNPAAAGDR